MLKNKLLTGSDWESVMCLLLSDGLSLSGAQGATVLMAIASVALSLTE